MIHCTYNKTPLFQFTWIIIIFCFLCGLSYASSESRRIHNMATASGVTTAVSVAEKKLKNLSWETNPPSSDMLRSVTFTQRYTNILFLLLVVIVVNIQ